MREFLEALFRRGSWWEEVRRVKERGSKVKQGFWGMPRGGVPTKDVPSGDTR